MKLSKGTRNFRHCELKKVAFITGHESVKATVGCPKTTETQSAPVTWDETAPTMFHLLGNRISKQVLGDYVTEEAARRAAQKNLSRTMGETACGSCRFAGMTVPEFEEDAARIAVARAAKAEADAQIAKAQVQLTEAQMADQIALAQGQAEIDAINRRHLPPEITA